MKLSANKSSFKTINFKQSGLNFIVAKQKNEKSHDVSKTYNGVGKSLIIKIIHFCLGSDKKNYKSFCSELPDWEFNLKFQIGEITYEAKRSTNNPNRISINGEELTVTKFNNKMQELCFQIPDSIGYLSFRSLLPFFIRPSKKSYVSFDEAQPTPNPYQKMLYNSFLLGLDVFLAKEKHSLKTEQDRINDLEKNFKKDDLLRDFFSGQKDVSLTIDDLDDQIDKLEISLKEFKVAEDYYDVQVEADDIERELFQLNNEVILLKNNLDTIDESLQREPRRENMEGITKIYEEVNVHFNDVVTKKLSELEDFYQKLVVSRKRRLIEQKNKIESKMSEKSKSVEELQRQFDNLMTYLGEHGALDVFVSLSEKVSNLKSNRENLKKYQALQTEYKEKLRDIEKEQIEQSEQTDNYLTELQKEISGLKNYFRELVKRFYPNNIAGLSIENNDGNNKQRFNIEAKIESDNSDGINNVKIFCYDLTILFKGKNHNINFIFHDSRLFDGIDERQKAELMLVLAENFSNTNMQYIASINQNQLNEIKDILGEDKYKEIIEDNTILTLTDDDASEKVLGIQVDIEDK